MFCPSQNDPDQRNGMESSGWNEMFINETVQINTQTFAKHFITEMLPELFVSNIVSDDTSMADFTIRFIPHHIQLCGGQCTHTNVLWGPFRPLTVRYELENIKYNLQEEDRKQISEQAAQHQQQEGAIVKVLTENIFHSFRDTTFLQDVH